MAIVDHNRFHDTNTNRTPDQFEQGSVGNDPHAEKPTKALIGLGLLIAIGFAMYGLGGKQPGPDQPQVMAHSNVQR